MEVKRRREIWCGEGLEETDVGDERGFVTGRERASERRLRIVDYLECLDCLDNRREGLEIVASVCAWC